MKSHNNQLNHKAVSEAIKSLNAKDKEAVYRFMEIAEAVAKEGDERIARNIRDRVLSSVSDDLVSESWVQEIFTLLNDAVHQARKSVKEVIKKPVSKSKKQPNKGHKHPVAVSRKPKIKTKAELAAEQAEKEAMPGVFREVIVTGERGTQARIELFFGYSKKGNFVVRVHAVKSGDPHILTTGSTYNPFGHNMPQLLQKAIDLAPFSQRDAIDEAKAKFSSMQKAALMSADREENQETSDRQAA